MKKIMWIVAVLPVVVASMMLQVIPDMIPHKIGIFTRGNHVKWFPLF